MWGQETGAALKSLPMGNKEGAEINVEPPHQALKHWQQPWPALALPNASSCATYVKNWG